MRGAEAEADQGKGSLIEGIDITINLYMAISRSTEASNREPVLGYEYEYMNICQLVIATVLQGFLQDLGCEVQETYQQPTG